MVYAHRVPNRWDRLNFGLPTMAAAARTHTKTTEENNNLIHHHTNTRSVARHLMAHHETAVSRPRPQVARSRVRPGRQKTEAQPEQCGQCAAL